jgi:hypothetical protein
MVVLQPTGPTKKIKCAYIYGIMHTSNIILQIDIRDNLISVQDRYKEPYSYPFIAGWAYICRNKKMSLALRDRYDTDIGIDVDM